MTMTTSKPPSPARLSAISTSLLTSILELSQQNSLDLPVNPSTKSNIIKNLLSLRDGLIQVGPNNQDEILVGLRNQYGRIIGLVRGLGGMDDEIEGLDLKLPTSPVLPSPRQSEQPLIDVDDPKFSSFNLSNFQNQSNTKSVTPTTTRDNDHVRSHQGSSLPEFSIEIPARYRSRKEIEEDEELIRSENEQVQRIQKVLLDDQDRTLDELSAAISRQRDLSLHISSELEVQENLLDELDENLDFTSNRLTRANKKMETLFHKISKDGACWTIFGLVALLLGFLSDLEHSVTSSCFQSPPPAVRNLTNVKNSDSSSSKFES